ncbi:MAG: ATP-dependent helicase HrpB [Rhizobiaceae bacterium]
MNRAQDIGHDLPVAEALPALELALQDKGMAVLVAPPGAGKTTLAPLRLLDAPWRSDGAIILLEPRRLAARAAARRMAYLLGEEVGQTVGYRMRLDQKVSVKTRILVVTEGVFARMALDDPELKGVACVLFDEFHERSLDADLGLALALDIRDGFRPDLRLVVMSATLDGARVSTLLADAPVIESRGRAFPVDVRYADRKPDERLEDAVARAILRALGSEDGSILAFLPGTGEINGVARRLEGRLPADVRLYPLHGTMESSAQDEAIRPAPAGIRKVVLATSIAETSITIDGVRIVIDSGYQRLPVFEPATGLTRLETVRASKASVDQRAGRAGRTAPGIAVRLWNAGQTAALPPFTPPEIFAADLSGLILDLAAFGVADPLQMRFLDPPPAPALHEARVLLKQLGALDDDNRLTQTGAAMRRLALPARLAHMLIEAAKSGSARHAAEIAVLLTERGLGGNDADLDVRLTGLRRDRSDRAVAAKGLAGTLARNAGQAGADTAVFSSGALLLHAYPDRVAKSRGSSGRFVLANGRGAELDVTHGLAGQDWLVIADMQGAAQKARILGAAAVSLPDIESLRPQDFAEQDEVTFDASRKALKRRRKRMFGAILIDDVPLPPPNGGPANLALIKAIRDNGLDALDWTDSAASMRKRLEWLRKGLGEPWPDMADAALLTALEDWLLPFMTGKPSLSQLPHDAIRNGLLSLVPHDLQRKIDQLAPTHFTAPTGNNHPIRYEGDAPVLAIRVQELFGLKQHPSIAGGAVPLLLELLSPGHKPLQLTRDLPGFWRGSWADVRADMRGRYPKHVWPDDPANASPTARAKPRGT